jgi:DsbC/DsbD-like thiol-disulfide interchange protein
MKIMHSLEHFPDYCRVENYCHSERSEEFPHFARTATLSAISKKALRRTVALLALVAATATTQMGRAQLGGQFSGQFGNADAANHPKSYIVYAAESQTIPANRRAVLELRFQVVAGFHVNSHTPKSELLIPTTLTLQPASGVKVSPLVYPAGETYSFPSAPGEKVDVYKGNFTLKLPVVATAGEHSIDATLRYQACDNASCYPPKTVPVKILFTAK